jgi:putative nucleotidyltransferase with HDIG domain
MNANDRYLNSLSNLPPVPSLAVELLSFFKNPDRDLDQIVRLISCEPAMTVEILRRCNSAYFAAESPATSVFEALTQLGFYQVYCIVVAMLANGATSLPDVHEGVNVEQLWRHLVTTAIAASELAQTVGEPKEVAFTAGLLHDIGKLVLASVERSRYSRLQQECNGFGPSLLRAEDAAFGVNHASLGGCLLARWKLPPNIATAIILHHNSQENQPFPTLAAIIGVADLIAHTIVGHDCDSFEEDLSSGPILQSLKLGHQDISSVIANTTQGLDRTEALMLRNYAKTTRLRCRPAETIG